MNWGDPTIIGSLIGVAGGLLGVLIGGWVARGAFRTEYQFRKRNALRAVMIEITRNQATLARELDRVLPAWLARAHSAGPASRAKVKELLGPGAHLNSAVYDTLFAELVGTEFGSELMSYYGRIAWLNAHVPLDEKLDVAQAFRDYVQALARALLIADDLVPVLHQETRKARLRLWGRNLDVEEFLASRTFSRVVARLTKWDFLAINRFLDTGEKPADFDPILIQNRGRLEQYRDSTKKF